MKKIYACDLNVKVREAFKTSGIPRYAVANYLGVKPSAFYQWFLTELTPERRDAVLNAIRSIYRSEHGLAGSDRGSTVPERS